MKDYIVTVDCCSPWTTIGLARDGIVCGEANVDAGMRQSGILPGLLKSLLDSFDLRPGDVALYGVVTGPGSFTGIKVGVSFVTHLAWACQKMVVPLSSLECTAFERIGKSGGIAATVLSGGGGEIYGGLFESAGTHSPMARLLPDGAYTPKDFLKAVDLATEGRESDVVWLTDRPERTASLFPGTIRGFERVIPTGSAVAASAVLKKESAVIPALIRAEFFRDPDTGRPR